MTDYLLRCDGLRIGNLLIPAFDIKPGEVLCLLWPFAKSEQTVKKFVKLLTGEDLSPALKITVPVTYADAPVFKQMFLGSTKLGHIAGTVLPTKLQRKFASKYLMTWRNTTRVLEDATILDQYNVNDLTGSSRLDCLEGNSRTILGIELAWQFAEVIIFDTNMSQTDEVYDRVKDKLVVGKAAIEFSFPKIDRVTPGNHCFPGAKVLSIVEVQSSSEAIAVYSQLTEKLLSLVEHRISRDEASEWAEQWINMPAPPVGNRLVWEGINALAGARFEHDDGTNAHSMLYYYELLNRLFANPVVE